ncbi:MAG: saccharopine dehydrogenase NADP-binding domain-containing protein [Planctomycetes bacterium]|nr:saccharopine dehydrogenase NADP-binding domain-containing protein [Planctomycetota bacterium]
MNRYVVLGAGRQGTAAAYDLAVHGGAASVLLADADAVRAREAAARVNRLASRDVARGVALDAGDPVAVRGLLEGQDAALSALPYRFNVEVTRAAIAGRCHLADLGGNTGVVRTQHAMHREAEAAGVTVVPDCGLAPGLGNTLAVHALGQQDRTYRLRVRCGGLPERPVGPLGYKLVFSPEGLTNEYTGPAQVLRGARRVEVEALTEPEELVFEEPVGRCEAFITSGGLSTLPWTLEGRLAELDYKTVRYPGHLEKLRLLAELGLLETRPVALRSASVAPRELLHALLEERLRYPEVTDRVVLRVVAEGERSGRPHRLELEVHEVHDPITGFTAMERTTAFPAAIVVAQCAAGELAPGARPLEVAVPPGPFVERLESRGIQVRRRDV